MTWQEAWKKVGATQEDLDAAELSALRFLERNKGYPDTAEKALVWMTKTTLELVERIEARKVEKHE